MDRFSELRAFVDVVEAGSFSGAARETGQSRSSVNRLVIALEERLGVQLLHRTTRSVSTNSNGRALYERAKQILSDLEEVELSVTAARRVPVGKLRISAPHSFGDLDFSDIVAGFLKQYPQVQIEISFENRLIDPVTEGYDLVIRVAEPDEETLLVDHRIMTLDYLLCASPAYLKEHGVPKTAECLKDHHGLSLLQSEQSGFWGLLGPDGPVKVKVRPVLRANTMDALLKAATEGLGIAVLPEYAIRSDLEAGRLEKLLSSYQLPSRMLQVIYPPARHLSANVQAFSDFVSDWCSR
ncbi:LysR family transcriptional regulator [Ruegeria arenilitoris]|uniref:LysR family transcriptional regulator n=1 Tax=Ruegeria arenilitoris TaxID=1173585 RepID=UPI00147DB1CE|nr:LysR family transcriptional regulator [Ruegeria arenilitoris]